MLSFIADIGESGISTALLLNSANVSPTGGNCSTGESIGDSTLPSSGNSGTVATAFNRFVNNPEL
jgi:hypothetical protein